MKNRVLILLLVLVFLFTSGSGISQALTPGPLPGVGAGVGSDENDTSAVPPGTTGNSGAGVNNEINNQINNTTNTTNNANTDININGSTITNSNIGSNNQVTQSTEVKNTNTITVKQEVSVLVNGRPLQSDVPSFINGDDRTMVTLRAIAEALGAKVDWDEATQTITITLGDKVVKLVIGQNSYTVNGQEHPMDTAAAVTGGRTVVPARVIGEALGAKVGWNPQTSAVTVDSGSQTSQPSNSESQTNQQTTSPASQTTQPANQANQQGTQPADQTTQQTSQTADWKAKFPIYPTKGDSFTQPVTRVQTNAKLSDSGLFEANTTVNLFENYSIKVKVNIAAFDANGNTLWTGGKEYDLKEKMPLDQWTLQVPADVMPKVTAVSIQHLKLGSQQLDQNPGSNTGATSISLQPLTAHEKNDNLNLVGTWHMESSAILDLTSGKLDVNTKTWDTDPAFGFTGAVQVGVWDSGGNLLWTSNVQTFGVDSPAVAALSFGSKKSSREDSWSETVTTDILSKAVKLEIRHGLKHNIDQGKNLF